MSKMSACSSGTKINFDICCACPHSRSYNEHTEQTTVTDTAITLVPPLQLCPICIYSTTCPDSLRLHATIKDIHSSSSAHRHQHFGGYFSNEMRCINLCFTCSLTYIIIIINQVILHTVGYVSDIPVTSSILPK